MNKCWKALLKLKNLQLGWPVKALKFSLNEKLNNRIYWLLFPESKLSSKTGAKKLVQVKKYTPIMKYVFASTCLTAFFYLMPCLLEPDIPFQIFINNKEKLLKRNHFRVKRNSILIVFMYDLKMLMTQNEIVAFIMFYVFFSSTIK